MVFTVIGENPSIVIAPADPIMVEGAGALGIYTTLEAMAPRALQSA